MGTEHTAAYLAQSKVTDLIVGYTIPIPLELLSTGLRLWAELGRKNGLAFDDYLMVWATIVSVGVCISGLVYGPPYGMGRHIEAVSPEDVKTFMLGDYVFSHFYDFAIASTKLSVLGLYYRVFATPGFRVVVIITATFVLLWLATMEFVLGFQCRPIAKFWDSDVDGQCFDLVAFSYFTNVTNLATDIWIFLLPLPIILKLQIKKNKKIGLSFLFSVGLATCAVSAARLSVVISQGSSDFTWAGVPLGILSVWEPLGGILCANLPIIYKPLLATARKVTGSVTSSRTPKRSGHSSWYKLDNTSGRGNSNPEVPSMERKDRPLGIEYLEPVTINVESRFEQESYYEREDTPLQRRV